MNRSIIWAKWKNPIAIREENDNEEDQSVEPYRIVYTAFGPISFKMFAPIKNNLKFYSGDANFDIDEAAAKNIIDTEGVEIFDIIGPYKFRVCVGKNFNHKAVLKNINRRLGCISKKYRISQDVLDEIDLWKKKLSRINNTWIIYVLPNGKYEFWSCANKKEYGEVLNNYKEAQKALSGYLITGV